MDTIPVPPPPKLATVKLVAEIGNLTPSERAMVAILIEAADQMELIYWQQMVGTREAVLQLVTDPEIRRRIEINAGPWERLADDQPFVPGYGERPKGVRFYPPDMTVDGFDRAVSEPGGESLRSPYTVVRRDTSAHLTAVPYHVAFEAETRQTARLLRSAAALAEDSGLRRYLSLRADALEDDDYRASDEAWMEMKSNTLDLVIGPIEVYDDKLFGYKASHQAIVLVKDRGWSQRIGRYAELLPGLQAALPVPVAYRSEKPGLDADLNVYDAIYHTGYANRPPTASAINLPNDEEVALSKGTRRLQLKNVMQAKFDVIVRPIAEVVLGEDQLGNLAFDAWFEMIMFHEIAHGLGLRRTIDGRGTVRHALRDQATPVEEQKADALGLFMLRRLTADGDVQLQPPIAHYVAHLADSFRLLRFGRGDAYSQISASELHFLMARGAVLRDATGRYRIEPRRASEAIEEMAARLLMLQGNGDRAAAIQWYRETGSVSDFDVDLKRLASADIPVDLVYEQGLEAIGFGDGRDPAALHR